MALISLNNESKLLALIAEGNESAFETLFLAYHNQLGSFVYHLTTSRVIAEEIVQEVFIEIWVKRHQLTHIGSFKNYVFILTKNRALNALRKIANEKLKHDVWGQHAVVYEDAVGMENVMNDYNSMLDEAITKLPPQQQKVFRMSKIECLKQEEIAKILNLSPETVKKHMKLALRFLRSYLSTNIDVPIVLILLTTLFY